MVFYKHAFLPAIFAVTLQTLSGAAIAQDWPTQSTPEWEALLASGQADGELVIIGHPALSDEFIKNFEADTGIDVRYVSGSTREANTRFRREVESGAPGLDIYLGGTNLLGLADAGMLMDVSAVLVLPEVTNPENWREGVIPFSDAAGKYLPSPSNYLSGLVLVNSNLVDPTQINTWNDLLRPEYRGKIGSQYTAFGGSGITLAVYLAEQMGTDYVEALFSGQEVELTREYRLVTDWVARGTYPISLGALPTDITRYQAEGLDHLVVLEMSNLNGYMVGGSAVLNVAQHGPNPNASAVFANWYMSQRGQESYSGALNVPSERLDVTGGNWPAYIEPLQGHTYQDTYDEIWRAEHRLPLLDVVKAILEQ